MPFREALKYAIRQKSVKIKKELDVTELNAESNDGEVVSDAEFE